jgi:hypothetical protein
MMTASEFGLLIDDAGLIGSSSSDINDELTVKEVRQAFAAAQTEVAFGAEERALVSEAALSHLQLMSYPEFIEGVSRLGALKWEEKSIPVLEKIELAVTAITQARPPRAAKGMWAGGRHASRDACETASRAHGGGGAPAPGVGLFCFGDSKRCGGNSSLDRDRAYSASPPSIELRASIVVLVTRSRSSIIIAHRHLHCPAPTHRLTLTTQQEEGASR